MIITIYRVENESTAREFNNLPEAQSYCVENELSPEIITTSEQDIIPPPPDFEKPSFAVDKGPDAGFPQNIWDDIWNVVTSEQILWDKSNDFELDVNTFEIKWDGIYFLDAQIRIENFMNVARVELALFKETDDPDNDDYWFILDEKSVVGNILQIKGSTSFNFYAGERYKLKIKLKKIDELESCYAAISGSDDYTAWGVNYIRDL